MQGKGLITAIAIILGLICINELLPTFYSSRIEKEALALSGGNEVKYQKELEKLSKDTLNLGIMKLDYHSAKEKEMKLGLDLKGGINVLLEINQRDLVNDLTNYSTNPVLEEALNRTDRTMKTTTKTYIENFFTQFDAVNKEKGTHLKLSNPEIFGTQKLSDQIKFNTPDDEVKRIISKKIEASVGAAFEVIRTRIDKLGVTQPNVQRVPGTGRILVEMPGIKDIDRVKKLLQTSARLQFWEVQTANEVLPYFDQLQNVIAVKADSLGVNKNTNLMNMLDVQRGYSQNGVAFVKLADTATVRKILNSPQGIKARPANLRYTKFMWAAKPESSSPDYLTLYAIRGSANNKAPLDGAVKEARVSYDQIGRIEISMQMDSEGTKIWKTLTEKNVGRPIAVTLDDNVYTAPNVNTVIPNGQSVITGNFSQDEAKDLVDVLNSGKLPATAKIVQADVVGPSLGAESINSGMISFVIAFAIIMIYIIGYYGMAGVFAVIAMIINLFYIFGIMDSIDATLTLPGIAGIVLTMGMAVDTNVIIYERTKEELFAGKGIREAYHDGFKHALSAIIDGHSTTLLTAIVLYVFGTGPIQGFAVTLIIGLLMTFFTSVLIARVMIFNRLNKGKDISVWTPVTKNLFKDIWIDFIGKRKIAYIFSTVLMIICLGSIFTNGFKFGVDFKGGRTYVVRFDKPVEANKVQENLQGLFKTKDGQNEAVDVKTFGNSNQLRITTDYKIDDVNTSVDTEIENKLYQGLKPYLPANTSLETFRGSNEGSVGIVSSTKVGPTVADDIQVHGTLAVAASLLGIFIYILFRFKKWQFSLGAVLALFHDAVVILGVFSLFYKVAPFNMEINQDFIAAVLTVLGYSINDTVIVFDRIREYLREKKSLSLAGLFDDSISSTLGRTFNTSMTTILVILAIFLFGGDSMKGFMFALLIGIGFGTYSSIFVASAVAYDAIKGRRKDEPAVHELHK
ncbi:protein translocase subunit SecD [Elizabethkingia sp. JS20170427COW]|uniref:protein translocase subunit SecD n=1 Tax=Elizabethkingia sp. JS20170427COW TaxID=2583851 RepID=UPI0011108A72|nr:protein translocase subunit SecD [Elizabethkingia sp. JS20170427COW]QCX53805.1 protein translocase subunit SecD [Elizabethkingia sp. JS20170427COW]